MHEWICGLVCASLCAFLCCDQHHHSLVRVTSSWCFMLVTFSINNCKMCRLRYPWGYIAIFTNSAQYIVLLLLLHNTFRVRECGFLDFKENLLLWHNFLLLKAYMLFIIIACFRNSRWKFVITLDGSIALFESSNPPCISR